MRILLGLCLVVLSGCGSTEKPPPPPLPVVAPPPPAPPPPPVAAAPSDTCGAQALQSLVGRPKSEIPVPTDMSKRRVYCSFCAITMDYREDRLNIVFDGETGIIKAVKCG